MSELRGQFMGDSSIYIKIKDAIYMEEMQMYSKVKTAIYRTQLDLYQI